MNEDEGEAGGLLAAARAGRKLECVPATLRPRHALDPHVAPGHLRTGAPHNQFADPKQRRACCFSDARRHAEGDPSPARLGDQLVPIFPKERELRQRSARSAPR